MQTPTGFWAAPVVADVADEHHAGMEITAGVTLEVTTASGARVKMRALGAPTQGHDFLVVWVCTEHEYERAQAEGDEPDGLPWPLNAVRLVEPERMVSS